jgi:serine/threonine protein kinase
MDALVTKAVKGYEIQERIGSGGFGVVYKGYDEDLRRDVAVKVPRRDRIAKPEDAQAYLAEGGFGDASAFEVEAGVVGVGHADASLTSVFRWAVSHSATAMPRTGVTCKGFAKRRFWHKYQYPTCNFPSHSPES